MVTSKQAANAEACLTATSIVVIALTLVNALLKSSESVPISISKPLPHTPRATCEKSPKITAEQTPELEPFVRLLGTFVETPIG